MKVLFVDDEPMILNGIRRALYRSGWKISIADGPYNALDVIDDLQPDVIISDAIMPGMNGVQFLQRVSEKWPGIARFILSGQADESVVLQGSQIVHGWYTKPSTPAMLNEQLEKIAAIKSHFPEDLPDINVLASASPLFSPLSLLKQHMQCVNGQVCALGNADISELADEQRQGLREVARELFPHIDIAKMDAGSSLADIHRDRFEFLLLTDISLREPGLLGDSTLKTSVQQLMKQVAEQDDTSGMAQLIALLKPFLRNKMPVIDHVSADALLIYMMHVWSLPYSVIHKVL